MNKLTRDELCEALKVPHIMGRGEAFGVVIGTRRFNSLRSWACENDETCSALLESGVSIMGMKIIITMKHPDTFFAVTESEYETMQEKLSE